MSNNISGRLKKISEKLYEGNDSAMARSLDTTPQSMYRYIKGSRVPGTEFLIHLAKKEININWLLTGQGKMCLKEQSSSAIEQEPVGYYIKGEKISKLLHLIIERLKEVEYSEQIKLEILKQTLEKIVIEQNTHFVENQLKE